jgi:hypothetical protein
MHNGAIEHAAKHAVTGPHEHVPVTQQPQCIDELGAMGNDSSVCQGGHYGVLKRV